MRIISTNTSDDLKKIHSEIEMESGLTLEFTVERTSEGIFQKTPEYAVIREIADDECHALDRLTGAFIDILECNEWESDHE
jgi:hypothetical protein